MTIEDLPEFAGLQVVNWHVTDDEIHVVARPVRDYGICPECGQRSDHLHSHYQRQVRDLPLCHHRLVLDLEVRRFRCTNPMCNRKVFCERLEVLVAVYQRRSLRLVEVMCWLSLRVSAEDGERILRQVGVDSSPDTLLREARKSVSGARTDPSVRVVGLDDFAFRKGQTYGTVVINLETHRPIILLPDREVATVRDWLAQHSEVVAGARDRFNGYGEACAQGAPQATQIADRWHLLKNLSDTLEKRLAQAYGQLKRWWTDAHPATLDPPSVSEAKPSATVVKPLLSPGRQKRLERIHAVKSLKQLGMNNSQIARRLRLSRQSVITYQQRDEASYLRPFPARISLLDGFKTYIQQRFAEGCTTATALFGEIRAMGYRGAYGITKRFVAGLRENQPAESNPRATLPTPRTLTWDILKNTLRGNQLLQLSQQHPEVHADLSLLVEGWQIIRSRAIKQWPDWMFRLRQSTNLILKNMALSFYKDRKVIENALLLPHSTSPVEGNINKLKLLKRQMYGRGKLDLLTAKFICTI